MKRLLLLACLLFSLNGVSQSYEKFDKDLQIVRRDCELIIITTDSLFSKNLRLTEGFIEEFSCFSSVTNSSARMFWFKIEAEEEVFKSLNCFSAKIN